MAIECFLLASLPDRKFLRNYVEIGEDGPFLSRIAPSAEVNNREDKMDCQIMEECRDNRALVDNNTAQSLTGDDIDELRKKGATGDEIVEALIANSATFEKKTAFSQEKYRIKKQKKYAPRVLVRRPFARRFLRVDTLSLLLSFANVTAHSNVLVLDMLDGLITGAVAERLGGMGYVCNTYCGVNPYPISIVRMFNFSDETCKRIVNASLAELRPSQTETLTSTDQLEDACSNKNKENKEVCMEESTNVNMDTVNNIVASPKINKSIKAGDKAPLEAINSWKDTGFSSLIIAAPDLDAWSIAKELVPLLSYSAPFVIYHQYLQPLASCMHNLQIGKMAIGLQITEPWLREFQVLPSRTHPHMQMSSSGGYLLSGIRINGGDQARPN
ncbi:tRNA (adenine(58)-n(1))-methyltransferase non-catalytic subunit trm6 [Phtheirospermum japonicum]|uniref:tRNA (adenine(58)-N(1))-methyltransferase non-catalytic subunit TRM6 n=1 Tax=Phtheirospermum japonicum TaxID=374723 RepID=A0A830CJJ8_9LAMI|nr:tRNA (adenine(58)-n(1))-methyltransferase non-catalytic subunit trm6 [Phtheirospermum japonicum]